MTDWFVALQSADGSAQIGHALPAGGRETACGLDSSAWAPARPVAFPSFTVPTCRVCVRTVATVRVARLHSLSS